MIYITLQKDGFIVNDTLIVEAEFLLVSETVLSPQPIVVTIFNIWPYRGSAREWAMGFFALSFSLKAALLLLGIA